MTEGFPSGSGEEQQPDDAAPQPQPPAEAVLSGEVGHIRTPAEINAAARQLLVETEGWFVSAVTPEEWANPNYIVNNAGTAAGMAAFMAMHDGRTIDVSTVQVHTTVPKAGSEAPRKVRRRDFEVHDATEGGLPGNYDTVVRPANYALGSANWTEQAGSSEELTIGLQFTYQSDDPTVTVQRGHDIPDRNITEEEFSLLKRVTDAVPESLVGGDIPRAEVQLPPDQQG